VTTAANIRAAALGPTPAQRDAICTWVGYDAEFERVMHIIDRPHHYWHADESTQRTFLLLVAEDMEPASP
jgi:hypothetical protein